MPLESQKSKEPDPKQLGFGQLEQLAQCARRKIQMLKDGSYQNALGERVGYVTDKDDEPGFMMHVKSLSGPVTSMSETMTQEATADNLLPSLLKEGYEL
jgi:hypothetical protein